MYQLFIDRETLEEKVNRLSGLLLNCGFTEALLTDLKQAQDNYKQQHQPQAYLAHPAVQQAKALLESNSTFYPLQVLKLWYHQPHHFSAATKAALAMGVVVLCAALVLICELVALLSGKSKLRATGAALASQCDPTLQPAKRFAESCLSLNEHNNTAVIDFSRRAHIPSFYGDGLNVNHVVGNEMQTIHSWILPRGWRDYLVCQRHNDTLNVIGHSFHGSLSDARLHAQNGFPILNASIPLPAEKLRTLFAELFTLFLPMFCLEIKQSESYSEHQKGFSQGFLDFADDYKTDSDIIASVYGGVSVMLFLMFTFVGIKKGFEKWESCESAREALGLFKTIQKDYAPVMLSAPQATAV